MADISTSQVEVSDAELITAVRDGDTEAYGELFERHREAATRLAGQLVPGPDADDLVAEAFVRVLTLLQADKGPDEFFRAYLLTSIRRLHIDRIRRQKRVRSTDDEAELDSAVGFIDPAEMRFEQGAAAAAFGSLPERWQLVLWHLDVEGQKPADIAPLLGMSPNSVSALVYRAREGLRQAYLQNHLAPSLHASCRTTTGLLGSYVRKGLSARDTGRVEAHLDECSRCTGLYLELAEINSNLSGILAPAVLGAAATGYLAGGAAALTGIGAAVLAPIKAAGNAVAGAGTQGIVAAAVVVTVAAAGTIAVTKDFGTSAQDRPAAASSSAADTPAPAQVPAETKTTEPRPKPRTTTSPPPPTSAPAPAPTPAAVVPTPSAPAKPSPRPKPTPPAVEPIAPTDYAIASVRVSNDLLPLLQRRITVGVSATNAGRAADQAVTVTLAFQRTVHFSGVSSPGWSCGALPDQRLRTLTCSTRLAAGRGTTFVATARNLLHASGTASVKAAGDPVPGNDSVAFRSGLWPLS